MISRNFPTSEHACTFATKKVGAVSLNNEVECNFGPNIKEKSAREAVLLKTEQEGKKHFESTTEMDSDITS